MALVPTNSKAVVSTDDGIFKTPPIPKKRKRIIEEETFTSELEKIIGRDFFPDIAKLRAQNEYLDAEARNDTVKLRELQMKYRPTPKHRPDTSSTDASSRTPLTFSSPATFETPASPLTRGEKDRIDPSLDKDLKANESSDSASVSSGCGENALTKKYGLDDFLARVTSEDNASFEDIMEESYKKHRLKYSWLYEDNPHRNALSAPLQVALPSSGSSTLAVEYKRPNSVETWDYKARNAVMQVPEGIPFTPEEITERDQQKIVVEHLNTRFSEDPWKTSDFGKHEASVLSMGKFGPDGKEIGGAATPQVNGYGFLPSPSPMPGVGESPMMTWGEIEGTPFILDASDTPARLSTPGPQFKIPEIPERDRLHLEMVDTVTKRHRVKREDALKQVRSLASTQTPKLGSALSAERLANMSPAAQRFATAKLGIRVGTDKRLSASYTPSPKRNPSTPLSSSGKITQSPRTPSTPTITDNLLDIRKNFPASSSGSL